MRRDLGGFLAVVANLVQVLANLLAARTGGIEVLLGVAFDLGCAATPAFDFVAELS